MAQAPAPSCPPLRVDDVRRVCAGLPEPGRNGGIETAVTSLAAIVVPVLDVAGRAAVLATKRPAGMRRHRGDWVFPGGEVDPGDRSLVDAARREASEELGIERHDVEIVGQLDAQGPILGGFLIHVFVGVLPTGVELVPAADEVEEVRAVALDHFLQPGRAFLAPAPGSPQPSPALMPWYEIGPGEHLWGTQGFILQNLLSRVTGGAHRPQPAA